MKFTFDGKEIPTGSAGPLGACGGGEAAWWKSAGVRIVVVACVIGAVLFWLLKDSFVSLLTKMLIVIFQTMLLEIVFGMVFKRRICCAANEPGSRMRSRIANAVAWCADLLVNGAYLALYACLALHGE